MGTLWLYYEEKNILRPIGAFFLLKLKIPIQNRAKIGPRWKNFSVPWSIDCNTCTFLYARDHAWSNGKDALQSIALETTRKKIDIFHLAFYY